MSSQHFCTECSGNGREACEEKCMMCHGEGTIERKDVLFGTISGVCSSCRGHGAIKLYSSCSTCNGAGMLSDKVVAATTA